MDRSVAVVRSHVMVVASILVLICLTGSVYAQSGGLFFEKVSVKAGLQGENAIGNFRRSTNKYWGTTVSDFNGDGWYDLLLSNHNDRPEFYLGGPDGFKQKNLGIKADLHGTAACDIDGDGGEEFIILKGGSRGAGPKLLAMWSLNPRNNEISDRDPNRVGIREKVRGRSLAFFDVDGDGDRDLLLVNRKIEGRPRSHLIYENVGGRFQLRRSIGFEKTSANWFCLVDIDSNGYLDVILMSFGFIEVWMGFGSFQFRKQNWRLPGGDNRIEGARACAEIDIDNDGKMEIYLARGDQNRRRDDILYRVGKEGGLINISGQYNIPKSGRHSHVTVFDADNDGKMDIYVSVMSWYQSKRIRDIFLKNVGGRVQKLKIQSTGLMLPYKAGEDGDNAIGFDYDRDGRVDVLMGSRNGPWRLYKNKTPRRNNKWLRVAVGRPRAGVERGQWDKDPWGALVRVECGGKVFLQRTGSPGMSHSISNMYRLTFGLGTCTNLIAIRVTYIGGVVATRFGGRVNRELKVGLLNCPGINCNRNIRSCASRCNTGFCERYEYRGVRLFCPAA